MKRAQQPILKKRPKHSKSVGRVTIGALSTVSPKSSAPKFAASSKGQGIRPLIVPSSGATVNQPLESATSRLLTVSEVADLLALSEKTIRRWIAAGRLPAVRFGRVVRVSTNSLEKFIQNCEDFE